MRNLALFLALAIAPLSHGTTFRFDPPVPDNATTTILTMSTTWPDGCPDPTPDVAIGTDQITLAFERPAVVCVDVLTPYTWTINLGVLPAGVYSLNVSIPDVEPAGRPSRLVVRDVKTFTITPAVGPISGGTHVRVVSPEPFDVEPIHVSIGGVEVPVTHVFPNTIDLVTPQHGAGPADVAVGSHVARAAFTYYDPNAATPDPFVFTPLLFPIDVTGAGAFGAQWTTDNVLEVDGVKSKLPVTGSASGVVVPELRSATVFANSRIRDTSRSAQTAGTEIPVVRENDFRERLRLLNVPTGSNLRALLRVWTSGEPASFFTINIDQIPTFAIQTAPLQPGPDGLRYGTFDLTAFLNSANDHLDVSAGVTNGTRIWGMISITNNETQQVTIISPQ